MRNQIRLNFITKNEASRSLEWIDQLLKDNVVIQSQDHYKDSFAYNSTCKMKE